MRTLPPPCDDEEKTKAMLEKAVGVPPPGPDATDEETGAFLVALIGWMAKNGLTKDSTPQQMCDALVKSVAEADNGKPMSTTTKVGLAIGIAAIAGVAIYYATK